jgi:hypothetical protein
MHAGESLSDHVSRLADNEVIALIREGGLTEAAAGVYQQEAVARGIDLENAILEESETESSLQRLLRTSFAGAYTLLHRGYRFPLRAALGLEATWKVLVFGGGTLFLLYKAILRCLMLLLEVQPIPSFAFSLACLAFTVFILCELWFCLALWMSARRLSLTPSRFALRALVLLLAFGTTRSIPNVIELLEYTFWRANTPLL